MEAVRTLAAWLLLQAGLMFCLFAVFAWGGQLLPTPLPQVEWRIVETQPGDDSPVRSVLGFDVTDGYDGTLTLGSRMLLIGSERALLIESMHTARDGRVVLVLRGREPLTLFLRRSNERFQLVWEDEDESITFVSRNAET